ncbi:MAG: metal-dependent hydrolase [Acidobacteria bacterium]|nr:metal-dependent hydrolase [Acidobacteriota bacterium]
MPSPIGHALAGVAAAWTADLVPGRRAWRAAPAASSLYERAGGGLTLACAALAVAPDLDLLFGGHRTVTHSIGALIFVALFAAAMAANAGLPIARVALMCAAAYGSHLLLDWLGADARPPFGIQALWPFDRGWYISSLAVFRKTVRFLFPPDVVVRENAWTIAREIAILGPIVAALWRVRVKALARLAAQASRRHHPPQ